MPIFEMLVFAAAGAVIVLAGTYMAKVSDELADRTGMGEAVFGALMLGAATSLPGVVASVSAALADQPSLAVSNAVGGIAAQTTFLVIADAVYRRANLEHAAAEVTNLWQSAGLILLLALALGASLAPPVTFLSIHPVTIVLFGCYLVLATTGMRLRHQPSWSPDETALTHPDEPDDEIEASGSVASLALRFVGLAVALGVAGHFIAWSASAIAISFGISQTVAGVLLTSVVTSLPELVTTIAAVRLGALQLAVGGIVGGNTFDVLFLAFADAGYRSGSVYHAAADRDVLMIAAPLVMATIMLLGLIARDRRGVGREGYAIVGVYVGVVALQVWLG
ncbi:MAG: sodium:calcium antiporter [Pseudomonadota bacterium]